MGEDQVYLAGEIAPAQQPVAFSASKNIILMDG